MDEYITRLNGHIAHLEGMVMSVQGQQVKLATDLLQEKIEHNAAKERIAELEAENARLREALHQVRNIQTPTVIPWTHETAADTYWKMIDHLKWVARAALAADSGAADA